MTVDKAITVKGKVFFNDGRRRIDIKKPIRDLFEGSAPEVGYIMEFCLSKEKLTERINELSENNITPVIMYFTKEGDANEQ